jgi:hypothetical protein
MGWALHPPAWPGTHRSPHQAAALVPSGARLGTHSAGPPGKGTPLAGSDSRDGPKMN